ncbi:hypothetical protein ALC56_03856 [Trachymyrmex septentrionalis]|uniref:Uncharacterized protein n=1 Tax=Trachymyrmex septentrionalis TaxID=34720 RepID=A0A195FML5_9HYME|nr:hypothetical protein ALC56_03856 [Trachymyrmex septentrionalis]
MHAEALTRGNLSRRPVLPFRDVYDERGGRSARGLNEKSARATTRARAAIKSDFPYTEKRSGKNVVPYGLHPPSYNAWSSSCARSTRVITRGKLSTDTAAGREFRLPSNKGVHERAEGNPGGPSRTKAVAAVIIVDVDADWASPSFQLTKQPSETKVPDGRLGFPSFWKLSVWTRSP